MMFLVFVQMCSAQAVALVPDYENLNGPTCGWSFHLRRIQGTVTDSSLAPVKDVDVAVFDDASHKLLGTTKTDEQGRFIVNQHWPGKLRIVFDAPGFQTDDWAVRIVKWPDGGFFHPRVINDVLQVGGDRGLWCPPTWAEKLHLKRRS